MKIKKLKELIKDCPDDMPVFFRLGDDRRCSPVVSIVNLNQYPAPEELVLYISSFYHEFIDDGYKPNIDTYSKPLHEYRFEVCIHGRDMMGRCGACDADWYGEE